jgi:hypothetical protein
MPASPGRTGDKGPYRLPLHHCHGPSPVKPMMRSQLASFTCLAQDRSLLLLRRRERHALASSVMVQFSISGVSLDSVLGVYVNQAALRDV